MKSKGQIVRAVLVILAVAAALIVTRMMPDEHQGTSTPSSKPVAQSSSSSPVMASSTSSSGAVTGESAARWQKIAQSFISRYDNSKGGRGAWLKRLRPVVSDDVYEGLKSIHLENLPAGSFGAGEVVSRAEVGGTVRFPLRGGSIGGVDVTVSVADEGTLRVTGFVPVSGQGVS